jgi:hypothetical protein
LSRGLGVGHMKSPKQWHYVPLNPDLSFGFPRPLNVQAASLDGGRTAGVDADGVTAIPDCYGRQASSFMGSTTLCLS